MYCSVDQEIAEPIIAEFEKQSGIKVLARFDTEASKTTGLVQKIKAEAASPVADVFWSSEIFHTIRLADAGLPHREGDIFEAELRDADEVWLTSSSREVMPVTRLNGKPVADGSPGPLWRRMMGLYQEYKTQLQKGEF